MNVRIASVAAALLLALFIPLKSFAEDQPKITGPEIAEGRSKAQIANALIILGRATKDPDMLIVAAKLLLSGIGASVADPKATAADGKPTFYDPSKLVEEAKTYSANRSSDAVTSVPNRSGFCHYEYLCDSLSCSYEWVCQPGVLPAFRRSPDMTRASSGFGSNTARSTKPDLLL
jgi:hypothetical protein